MFNANEWKFIAKNIFILYMMQFITDLLVCVFVTFLTHCHLTRSESIEIIGLWSDKRALIAYTNGAIPAQFVQPHVESRSSLLDLVLFLQKGPYIVYANSKDPDQTARMRSLVWIFAIRTCFKGPFSQSWALIITVPGKGNIQGTSLFLHNISCWYPLEGAIPVSTHKICLVIK